MEAQFEAIRHQNNSKAQEKSTFCTLDYYLLPTKICYLLKQAKFAVLDFTMLFYVNIGLNAAEAGMINGIQNIGGVIGAPLFALVADRFKIHQVLCILLSIASMLTFCVQPLLPIFVGDAYSNHCPLIHINKTSNYTTSVVATAKFNRQILFYGLLIVSTLASSFDGSVMSFAESAVLQRVRLSPFKSEYGKQRILGCIGTATGTFLYAFGVRFFPVNSVLSCYTGMFVAYFLLSFAFTISCYSLFKGLIFHREEDLNISENKISFNSEAITRLLKNTLLQFETISFMVNVFVTGILQAAYYTFTYMYLQQELHAETFLFPVSMTIGSVSGVCIYYNGSRVMRVIKDTDRAFCIIYFFWIVRYAWCVFMKNPVYVLITDPLTSLTYSLGTLSTIDHVQKISNPAILTTMSGIRNCLYNYFAYFLASIGGGFIMRQYGGKILFMSMAMLSAIFLFIMLLHMGIKRLSWICTRYSNYETIP